MNTIPLSTGTTALAPGENVAHPFDLDAGLACLDFINTLPGRLDDAPREFLHTYADLVLFAQATGDLDATTARGLAVLANAQPDDACRAHATALELREALYRIFSAASAGEQPPAADLGILDAARIEAASRSRIVASEDGFELVWSEDADLGRPIWSLARAAAELLLSDDRQRLRECAADDCGWIFIDTSRNRSRRWCSMSSCGNRAKVSISASGSASARKRPGSKRQRPGRQTIERRDRRAITL